MRFSIIIPTYGGLRFLVKCISSIKQFEKSDDYEIIVVDDGSPQSDRINLQNYCEKNNIKCFVHLTNQGFAHAVNTGIRVAQGDIVVLCNNDIQFTHPILSSIKATFDTSLSLGIIGGLLLYPNKRVQHAGLTYHERRKSFYHDHKNLPNFDPKVLKPKYVEAVTGALFAIKREVINKIGHLNEEYFLACEDTEYCLRAWEAGFSVYYNPAVSAIHYEGGTRGNTPHAKTRINKTWTKNEATSIIKFKGNLHKYNIKAIKKNVRELNWGPLKIEVGSGFNPHPGYLHLDVRKGLPQLDYVCDFSKDKLPFEDGEVIEILANHVIEHISFRKLPHVLKEWRRVLSGDGKLVLRTPDLRFICEKYLKDETTPEWPGDEKFIKEHLTGDIVTPGWWANLKLFSGQDYASNFHHVCFDYETLADLLFKYGFKEVNRVKLDKEFSPGELQVEAYAEVQYVFIPGAVSMNGKGEISVKPLEKKTALVIRNGAIGDVLLTTPIVKRLHDEGYEVDVATKCTEVLEGNPYIKRVLNVNLLDKYFTKYDKTIDLNLAYENLPHAHIIDAYSWVAFRDKATPHKIDFFSFQNKNLHLQKLMGLKYVVIHPAKSWENRTWPITSWNKLIELFPKDTVVVMVGARDDFKVVISPYQQGTRPITSLVDKLNLQETAYVIRESKLFIGPDSGLLHLAQAFHVPSIGLFTCAKAEYRTHSLKSLPIIPDIDCYGCLHDEVPPVTYCGCRRGDFKCLDLITPEKVFEAVKLKLNMSQENSLTL